MCVNFNHFCTIEAPANRLEEVNGTFKRKWMHLFGEWLSKPSIQLGASTPLERTICHRKRSGILWRLDVAVLHKRRSAHNWIKLDIHLRTDGDGGGAGPMIRSRRWFWPSWWASCPHAWCRHRRTGSTVRVCKCRGKKKDTGAVLKYDYNVVFNVTF